MNSIRIAKFYLLSLLVSHLLFSSIFSLPNCAALLTSSKTCQIKLQADNRLSKTTGEELFKWPSFLSGFFKSVQACQLLNAISTSEIKPNVTHTTSQLPPFLSSIPIHGINRFSPVFELSNSKVYKSYYPIQVLIFLRISCLRC